MVVAVRHLAGAEVEGTGDSIVVMGVGVLLPDCALAVLLFGVVVGVLFDCTFGLFCCLHANYPGTRVGIILVIFFCRPSNISGLSS